MKGSTRVARRCHLRKTKIKNLGVAELSNEQIGSFDVPMNDALAVGGMQRIVSKRARRPSVDDYRGGGCPPGAPPGAAPDGSMDRAYS